MFTLVAAKGTTEDMVDHTLIIICVIRLVENAHNRR